MAQEANKTVRLESRKGSRRAERQLGFPTLQRHDFGPATCMFSPVCQVQVSDGYSCMSHDILTNDTSSLSGLGQRVEITTNVRKEPLFVRRPGWEFHTTCDIVVTFSDVLATWYITSLVVRLQRQWKAGPVLRPHTNPPITHPPGSPHPSTPLAGPADQVRPTD